MKILILNGPNLNLLSQREFELYGSLNLSAIEALLKAEFNEIDFHFFQTNYEGDLVNHIQGASSKYDGIIINPGGYAHTSVAIKDALELCTIPKVEVHLSNLSRRESFRQNLITAISCDGYISGFKEYSYLTAVYLLQKIIKTKGN